MLPVAVARSSSDSVATSYVLPVLWMTSCFHSMALYRSSCVFLYRASIPMGQEGHVPPLFMKGGGTSMVMSPQYFRSDVVYDVGESDSNCCLLYFNANIMCSFTKKLQLLPQTPTGLRPGPRWGTSVPQTPSLLLCPPNNPVRSTPLINVVR